MTIVEMKQTVPQIAVALLYRPHQDLKNITSSLVGKNEENGRKKWKRRKRREKKREKRGGGEMREKAWGKKSIAAELITVS
jgi:hypothetical protein